VCHGVQVEHGYCLPCPAGSACSNGAVEAECGAGWYSAKGENSCSKCGSDNKHSSSGAAACSTCAEGFKTIGGDSQTRQSCVSCSFNPSGASFIGYTCDGTSVKTQCTEASYRTSSSNHQRVHVTYYPEQKCLPTLRTVDINNQVGCPKCTLVGSPGVTTNGEYTELGAVCKDASGETLDYIATGVPEGAGVHVVTYSAVDADGKWSYGCKQDVAPVTRRVNIDATCNLSQCSACGNDNQQPCSTCCFGRTDHGCDESSTFVSGDITSNNNHHALHQKTRRAAADADKCVPN
jgi:hypothetical protein